jgi:deoxyribodipyrimidine photolyase-related protein
MSNIFIIYPHQLFKDISILKDKKVLLIEESLFFTQYRFHIQKLIFHRASMKFYENYLIQNGIDTEYYEDESYIKLYKGFNIFCYDVVDDWLLKKILNNFKNITIYYNPNFYNVNDSNRFLHQYYKNRRKELNILIDNANPVGGKWSYDSENRKKIPKDRVIPKSKVFDNIYIAEAKEYCKRFDTIGEAKEFYYPTTFDEAEKSFESFLISRLESFGDYQDAIVKDESFLFHSNISSALNVGLLDLKDIIKRVLKQDVRLNTKEGFIRQIIGWREFMFSIYKSSHIVMRNSNFFGFSNQIPDKLISTNSTLTPVDDAIRKLNRSGYNHHIERLMVLGNIFLLLEIEPNAVYEFFMSRYIDAYDWVMVANVYGMSQFSDGGSITTKPYISSSNYILKMSNSYKKSDEWCHIWDGLYWRFLNKYKEYFKHNNRMSMQLAILDKMNKDKLESHIKVAQNYIDSIQGK